MPSFKFCSWRNQRACCQRWHLSRELTNIFKDIWSNWLNFKFWKIGRIKSGRSFEALAAALKVPRLGSTMSSCILCNICKVTGHDKFDKPFPRPFDRDIRMELKLDVLCASFPAANIWFPWTRAETRELRQTSSKETLKKDAFCIKVREISQDAPRRHAMKAAAKMPASGDMRGW